jgi:tetratricopeptide (TPR) repeat protein
MSSDPHFVILNLCLANNDLAGAEKAANAALVALGQSDGDALYAMARVRMQQTRWDDAVRYLTQANAAKPGQPLFLLHLGQVLGMLRQPKPAIAALSEAVTLKPDFPEAWCELGNHQQLMLQRTAAENSYRHALKLRAGHGPAKLGLGRLLLSMGRYAEAEEILTRGRDEKHELDLMTALLDHLLIVQARQNQQEAALETIARLQALDPARIDLQQKKIDVLLDLMRFDEALNLMQAMLERNPSNIELHRQYNDILYQLGRDEVLLTSYDRAPQTTNLQIGKAVFVFTQDRIAEANALFSDALAREPDSLEALSGVSASLDMMGRHDEALTLLEKAALRQPDEPLLQAALASNALHRRDPEKAVALLQKLLVLMPHHATSLSRLSTAWRMMGDVRDESLMGYDELVRVFDLEPPAGFSSMAAFNEELEQYLATLHPPTREFVGQSLRGGTQTRRHLFGAGHALVERLKLRIDEAIGRYIAELERDPDHPLRSRRAIGFGFAGSWSSRLSDCGFHVNHIHPSGWISSCYYAGLPEAVKDTQTKQGWIKFGEPDIDVGLSFRRAIQPAPGRLILFPSYMWHGTIPFRAPTTRTTIAFDVVPLGPAF